MRAIRKIFQNSAFSHFTIFKGEGKVWGRRYVSLTQMFFLRTVTPIGEGEGNLIPSTQLLFSISTNQRSWLTVFSTVGFERMVRLLWQYAPHKPPLKYLPFDMQQMFVPSTTVLSDRLEWSLIGYIVILFKICWDPFFGWRCLTSLVCDFNSLITCWPLATLPSQLM